MASTRSAPLCFAARCLHRLRTLQHGTECGRLPASRRGEGKPGLFTLFHTCSTVRFLDNPLPLPPDRLRLQDSPGFAVLLNRPRPCREALVLGTACSSCNSGTLPRRPTSRPRSSPRSAPRSPGRTGRGAGVDTWVTAGTCGEILDTLTELQSVRRAPRPLRLVALVRLSEVWVRRRRSRRRNQTTFPTTTRPGSAIRSGKHRLGVLSLPSTPGATPGPSPSPVSRSQFPTCVSKNVTKRGLASAATDTRGEAFIDTATPATAHHIRISPK